MLITTAEISNCEQYFIHDYDGNIIPYVISFDTETEEIELGIRVASGTKSTEEIEIQPCMLVQKVATEDGSIMSSPILVKFRLPGAYATKNGERL